MQKHKKILLFASILFFSFSIQAKAGEGNWMERLLKLNDFEVEISLGDFASGGCWTNLREVREYVEEKLRSKGVKQIKKINYESGGQYILLIEVIGGRIYGDGSGPCGGTIRVDLHRFDRVYGAFHQITMYGGKTNLAFSAKNFNNYEQLEYVDNMNDFYQQIDVQISRAGGGILEALYLNIPLILIPYKLGTTSSHQQMNAKFLVDNEYAIICNNYTDVEKELLVIDNENTDWLDKYKVNNTIDSGNISISKKIIQEIKNGL